MTTAAVYDVKRARLRPSCPPDPRGMNKNNSVRVLYTPWPDLRRVALLGDLVD